MKYLTALIFAILFMSGDAFAFSAETRITPNVIKNLESLPVKAFENLKRFENFSLATGKKTLSHNVDDEVGYGVTEDEVEDAIAEGFLSEGSVLPSCMTKEQADSWLYNITIPTYRSIVRKTIKVPLTLYQEAALVLFAQNAGRGNLRKLTTQKGRLNDGNYTSVEKVMPLYYKNNPNMRSRVSFHINLFKGKNFDLKT